MPVNAFFCQLILAVLLVSGVVRLTKLVLVNGNCNVMSKYKYVDLKNASGTVNVIVIVKYADKPKKTKGSGYSLLLAITDPSLSGDKMSCVIFHDSKENLPQIRGPGDIVVMHRLVVRPFNGRNQGCGCGTTGFSAAVFSGINSDPLVPIESHTRCSVGDEELEAVKRLREWYTSPNCPMEREEDMITGSTSGNSCQLSNISGSGVKRLGVLKGDKFYTIEGQIVSIYKSAEDNQSLTLYIWDGRHNLKHWNGNEIECRKKYTQDCLLTALAAPLFSDIQVNLQDNKDFVDWSVPVSIYDEHITSETVMNLKPGDLIRIHNVHAKCVRSEHNQSSSVRLRLHGGGEKYGSGVRYLGDSYLLMSFLSCDSSNITEDAQRRVDEANRYGLLENLKNGIKLRPPLLKPDSEFLIPYQLQQPLSVAQIHNLPLIISKKERELNNWDLLYPINTQIIPVVPPSSWLPVYNPPHKVQGFRTVTKVSVNVALEDPTGTIILTVSGCNVSDLLNNLMDCDLTPCIKTDAWWAGLVFEMTELDNIGISPSKMILEQLHRLLGQWIDVTVKISWSKESLSRPASISNHYDLQFNLIGWSAV
ncbi:unnamed protein product [Heterobilharzia americana]|nr:unnamed protein product [Heterobilharzia americana]